MPGSALDGHACAVRQGNQSMRATARRATALLTAFLLAAPAVVAAAPKTPAARLATALQGRTPGAPADCIYLREIRSSRIIDGIGILYETSNGTYYLNKPDTGASSLRWNTILVTDTHSPQLCSIDVVRLYDSASRMQAGFVGLGKFVPYARPAR
jgi:hypothetical protein